MSKFLPMIFVIKDSLQTRSGQLQHAESKLFWHSTAERKIFSNQANTISIFSVAWYNCMQCGNQLHKSVRFNYHCHNKEIRSGQLLELCPSRFKPSSSSASQLTQARIFGGSWPHANHQPPHCLHYTLAAWQVEQVPNLPNPRRKQYPRSTPPTSLCELFLLQWSHHGRRMCQLHQ